MKKKSPMEIKINWEEVTESPDTVVEVCEAGPESHDWKFWIEEGNIALSSDCEICNESLGRTEAIIEMPTTIIGKLKFESEDGGYYGDDYYWWYDFTPKEII